MRLRRMGREAKMEKRFFEYLTFDERVDCLALGVLAKHPADTTLVPRGSMERALHVILAGKAEVRRADGCRLALLGEGDVFGEMAFIQGSSASADVVATADVQLLTLSEAQVESLFKQRPGLAAGLYRSLAAELARRLRKTSDGFRP
jgi:CRP-like cAMP-binding protein